jgi:hypothetical protein
LSILEFVPALAVTLKRDRLQSETENTEGREVEGSRCREVVVKRDRSKNDKVERWIRWKGGKVEGLEGWKGGRVEGWKGGKVERWKGGRVKGGKVEGWKGEHELNIEAIR